MKTIIRNAQEKSPLIHHITNDVVVNFTANGVLSFGASPIMAKEITEVAEMANIADGLLLNIGTATREEVDAMILAGVAANQKGIPVVLDPVGIGASLFRQQSVERILHHVHITAIKGNAGEIAFLVGRSLASRGVDAKRQDLDTLKDVAIRAAKKWQTIIIVTGEFDVITDGQTTFTNNSGHPIMTKLTGAGCLLGAVICACLAGVDLDDSDTLLANAYAATRFYGKAGEIAWGRMGVAGPGTFAPQFIDALQGDFL